MGIFKNDFPVAPGSREANDNLRAWLRQSGDHGSTPRPVLHYAYPRHESAAQARTEIAAEMRRRGFEVGDATMRDGLVFRHDTSLASDRFDTLTSEIAELLAGYGWEYDAWECCPQMDISLVYWRRLDAAALR